jgi:hypothetical protein
LGVKCRLLRPDGFAIALFALGFIMFFLPIMLMPGLVAMLAALIYWFTMMVVNAVSRRRA